MKGRDEGGLIELFVTEWPQSIDYCCVELRGTARLTDRTLGMTFQEELKMSGWNSQIVFTGVGSFISVVVSGVLNLPDRDRHTPRGRGSGSLSQKHNHIRRRVSTPLRQCSGVPPSSSSLHTSASVPLFRQHLLRTKVEKFRFFRNQCHNGLLMWEAEAPLARVWLPRRPMSSSSSSFFFTPCRNWRGGLTDSKASSTRATVMQLVHCLGGSV